MKLLKELNESLSDDLEQFNERLLDYTSDELTDLMVDYGLIRSSEVDRINDLYPDDTKREELTGYMASHPAELAQWVK